MHSNKVVFQSAVVAAGMALLVVAGWPASAGAQPAAAGAPAAGGAEPGVEAVLQSLVKAFETRDAKALSEHWTAQGEFQTATGVELKGREALTQAFQQFLARQVDLSAQIEDAKVRVLSSDSAIEEGIMSVRRGPTEPAERARFSALLVRDAGAWKLARLVETSLDENSLEELDWLIGEWRSSPGEDVEIHTTYAWDENHTFIQVHFSRGEKELTLAGRQVIGVDPATGQIHTWTFEADGGIGQADWTRDGDHWVLESAGTLADGSQLSETSVIRRIDQNSCTWQSVNRTLDGERLPDLPPLKVTRVAGK